MNSTISRIALSAPVAVALVGFSISATAAAPVGPADHTQVQQQPEWVIVDDFDGVGPEDEPVDPPADEPVDEPADEPADEPVEEPAEDDSEESDDESDSDDNGDSGNGGASTHQGAEGNSNGSSSTDEGAQQQPVEAADIQTLAPASSSGVRVAPAVVGTAGVALAGVAGWAAYRRRKLTA